jgi:PIN domain nuclease of toxin-antitoxin system
LPKRSSINQLIQAMDDPASGITLAPITIGVSRAVRSVPRKLVPDMPDRIIAATAVHLGLPLVTADSQIHSSGIAIIW